MDMNTELETAQNETVLLFICRD